ncbi:MAG TPA: barstar family protein [Actinocrinis sp.]|nr:barstar family protein [Actinocrinis sp.]
MSTADPHGDPRDDVALRLMYNSFVRLFWRIELFEQAVASLIEHRYDVVRLDASAWTQESDLHRDIAAALDFPDYYGHNLDALNDCLRDVVAGEYGTDSSAAGFVLAFTGYDKFAARCPREAQIVLDIVADQARRALLTGHRVCCLVQSDDPAIRFEPVGAMPVMWNDAEWLDSNRQ